MYASNRLLILCSCILNFILILFSLSALLAENILSNIWTWAFPSSHHCMLCIQIHHVVYVTVWFGTHSFFCKHTRQSPITWNFITIICMCVSLWHCTSTKIANLFIMWFLASTSGYYRRRGWNWTAFEKCKSCSMFHYTPAHMHTCLVSNLTHPSFVIRVWRMAWV